MSEIRKEPEVEKKESQEEQDQYEQWMKEHPETVMAPKSLREDGPEIQKLEELLESFELAHSLEELDAIVDLTPELHALFGDDRDMSAEQIEVAINNLSPEDAKAYQARTSAKKDLIPLAAIVGKMNILEKEGNMLSEKQKELRKKYMRLSGAVGMINQGRIRHY